jgi:hypothetical protein
MVIFYKNSAWPQWKKKLTPYKTVKTLNTQNNIFPRNSSEEWKVNGHLRDYTVTVWCSYTTSFIGLSSWQEKEKSSKSQTKSNWYEYNGCPSGRAIWNVGLIAWTLRLFVRTLITVEVCVCFSVLCCPVLVAALRQADSSSRETYQLSKWFVISESNSELEQVKRPSPSSRRRRRNNW